MRSGLEAASHVPQSYLLLYSQNPSLGSWCFPNLTTFCHIHVLPIVLFVFSKLSDLFFFKYDFTFYREPLLPVYMKTCGNRCKCKVTVGFKAGRNKRRLPSCTEILAAREPLSLKGNYL